MRLSRLVVLFAIAIAAGCSHHADLQKSSSQDAFGVQMAKINLWREALFRFQRAVEINPGDAMAHNNLAVAYEANGDFDKARKEYLEALRLDRSNQYIQKNYSRYVEFLSRNRKRQQKDVKTAAATTPPPTPEPAATSTVSSNLPPATPPMTAASPSPPPVVTPPSDLPPQPAPVPPPVKPPGGGR
jgi:Flp pilus assembly protein TadD